MDDTERAAARSGLRDAFPGERLDIEWGDAWSSYLDADTFEAEIGRRAWTALDTQCLERHHDAISYASPSLFVAVLPAWLNALLEGSDAVDMLPYFVVSALTPGESDDEGARFRARVEGLTPRQATAVARALETLAADEGYADHRDDIRDALKRYWSTHLGRDQ